MFMAEPDTDRSYEIACDLRIIGYVNCPKYERKVASGEDLSRNRSAE